MLIENRNYLRQHNRNLLSFLDEFKLDSERVTVELSKKEIPTLKIIHDDTPKYVHSKYDPLTEADRFIKGFELGKDIKHVFLVGFGLGYQFEFLKEKYPYLSFTVYEPEIEILTKMLETVDINKLFTGKNVQFVKKENLAQKTRELYEVYGDKIQLLSLPFYEKYFAQEVHDLYNLLVENLKNKKSELIINLSFEKRWTLNAIKNFPTLLKTPNILHDIDLSNFEDKPAIIVSAGPSLNEEFENLKYIKEKGLAYIFAVGSAINSLIEKDIYPDATCSVDPKDVNAQIVQKIKDQNIRNIPLIFGSTVGYETLEDYTGPMLHMLTSQDTVAPRLLPNGKEFRMVADASSVAIITFQLLVFIGVKDIYLVGQNLSFKNQHRYADGIKNYNTSKVDKDKLYAVKSVHGEDVYTDENYDQMRKQFESYISETKRFGVKVYNTTKNGAAIEGAPFVTLEEVIKNHLKTKEVVVRNWFQAEPAYDRAIIKDNIGKQHSAKKDLSNLLNELDNLMSKIVHSNKDTKIEKQYANYDKVFKKIRQNTYYLTFIAPMVRVQTESLIKKSKEIKNELDLAKKKALFEKSFGEFLQTIKRLNSELNTYFNELQENIRNI